MANRGACLGGAVVVAAVFLGCALATRAEREKSDKAEARTLHVAPSGSDDADCSAEKPCKTLDFDRLRVKAGDTVVVGDGAYGGLRIVCGSVNPALNGDSCNGDRANARCGTPGAPITIRAEHERKVLLKVDGSRSAIHVEGCQYIVVQGFDTATADNIAAKGSNPTVADFRNSHVTFRRILGWGTNRCGNNQVFETAGSTDSLFEENEAWNHSRHAFSCSGADRITYRRNYVNNNGVTQSANRFCLDDGKPRGGTSRPSIALYPCSHSFVENNIIEGSRGWGINVEGATWSLRRQRPSSNNTVVGNVVAGTYLGLKVYTRDRVREGIADNVVRHFLALKQAGSFGIRDSVSLNTLYDHVTVYGVDGSAAGMLVDDPCTAPPCHAQLACGELTKGPASVTISNSAFCDNGGTQLDVQPCAGAVARRCTLTNVRASGREPFGRLAAQCEGAGDDQCACSGITTTPCAGLGTTGKDCVTYWPGTGLGADIRCRTENGNTLGGAANGLWAEPGDTPAPTTTCEGTTPAGPVTPCLGGFRFCGAVVAGKNDQAENCRTFAQRRLNQRADGKGCPLATVACP